MSWVRESETSWLHRCCVRILRAGPVPKHVAFIMDGNRRFAKKNSMDRAQGHLMGFDKLAQTLEWCLDLGITEVTVYAFSIENFKRSKEEVDGLMELSRQKFAKLMQEKEMIDKHGVCFRVLGNLSLLPVDIQEMIAEGVQMTKHNTRAILNVCFAYTARDEICTAMREVAEGVQMGLIRESDINENVLEKCLYTNKSQDPDLLIRTSGEVRLSDFLLWQSAFSVLSFMEVLWPDFSRWHLYAAVLHYQRHHKAVKAAKESHQFECNRLQVDSDHQCVLQEMQAENQDSEESRQAACGSSLQERLHRYTHDRQTRTAQFLQHVEYTRNQYFEKMCQQKLSAR